MILSLHLKANITCNVGFYQISHIFTCGSDIVFLQIEDIVKDFSLDKNINSVHELYEVLSKNVNKLMKSDYGLEYRITELKWKV